MKQELSQLKQDMIAEIEQRLEDKVLERSNAELLQKLITQADSDDEAIKIMSLGTTYKKSGLHYEKRLEKMIIPYVTTGRTMHLVSIQTTRSQLTSL